MINQIPFYGFNPGTKNSGLTTKETSVLVIIIFVTALLGVVFPLTDAAAIDNIFERLIISGTVLLIYALSHFFPPVTSRIKIIYLVIVYGVTLWSVFALFINSFSSTYLIGLLLIYLPVALSFEKTKPFLAYVTVTAAISAGGAYKVDFPKINPDLILAVFVMLPLIVYLFIGPGRIKSISFGGRVKIVNTMFSDFTDAIFLLDPVTGVIIDCNKEAVELLQADDKKQILNRGLHSFLEENGDDPSFLKKTMEQNIFENSGKEREFRTFKHHTFWGNIALKEVVLEDNPYILLRLANVSKRRMLDEALQSSEERFRALIENNYDVVIVSSIEGKILYSSPSITRCLGYSKYENLSSGIFDFIHPDERNLAEDLFAKLVAREQETAFFTVRFRHKNGEYKWLEVTASNEVDVKAVGGIVMNFTDVSERKNAEASLMMSEDRYQFLFEHSPVAIIKYDLNFNALQFNGKLTEVLHIRRESGPGFKLRGIVDDELIGVLGGVFSGEDINTEAPYTNPATEQSYYLQIIATPVVSQKNIITGGIAIIEDITIRKNAELEIISSKEKAEEANRLKSTFLANMSHELRTPMNSILGYTQILRDDIKDPQTKKMIEQVLRSGLRLMSTLNSILELSLLETGDVQLNIMHIDFVKYTEYIVKKYKFLAEEKKLDFIIKSFDEEVVVAIDEKMYNQAISNIMDNAIKFTESGRIEVELSHTSGQAFIRVRDTGLGIARQNQSIIFEEFRQVSEGYSRRYEGNGLGLPLVKKIVEIMDGTVEVESETGMGAVFTITLPVIKKNFIESIKRPVEREIFDMSKAVTDNVLPEILVVEDNPVNVEVVIMFLNNLCSVDFANTAEEALKKAKKKKYAIVLMDINLGEDVSGIDVAREIKKRREYANVPMVALTGYALAGDREKLLDEGFTDYLAKPIIKNELRERIASLLKKLGYTISQ